MCTKLKVLSCKNKIQRILQDSAVCEDDIVRHRTLGLGKKITIWDSLLISSVAGTELTYLPKGLEGCTERSQNNVSSLAQSKHEITGSNY